MAYESLTWAEQELAKLNAKLTQHHAAYQTSLLTGYYHSSAQQLGIKGGSAQHQLYLATLSLDRALASELRSRKNPTARLAYYRQTVKPLDGELTKLFDQLQHRGLLTQAQTLDQAIIDRQLIRIKHFKRTVQQLPEIRGNLFLSLMTFIQQLKAWVQGKPLPVSPIHCAVNNFVEANRAVLGVYYAS